MIHQIVKHFRIHLDMFITERSLSKMINIVIYHNMTQS